MGDVSIQSTHNDPVVGLNFQANQLMDQVKEYSTYDNQVISFHGEKTNKDEEIKLYMPVERYVNYSETEKEIINLLILFIFIFLVFAIITRNR